MLGDRLKAIRRGKNVTLRELAEGAGLSKSFISQVESGAVNPSIASLTRIVEYLGVPPSELLDDPVPVPAGGNGRSMPAGESAAQADVTIVRQADRKGLMWPGSDRRTHLLTPDLQRQMMVIVLNMEPGEGTGEQFYSHQGEEFGLALHGATVVTLKDVPYLLEEGDAIYFNALLPHKMHAARDESTSMLMVLVPPAF